MIFEIEICSFSFLVFPFANINSNFTLPTSLPTTKVYVPTLNFFEKGFQLHEYFQNRLPTYIFFSKSASNFQIFPKSASNFQLFAKSASNFQLFQNCLPTSNFSIVIWGGTVPPQIAYLCSPEGSQHKRIRKPKIEKGK